MPISEADASTDRPAPILEVDAVASGYGAGLVVRHVTIQAGKGEIVTIVGPNGSGKSTLLKTIAGLVRTLEGAVRHDGVDITHLSAHLRARRGLAYVPQEREVFSSLSVRENLMMGGFGLSRARLKEALARVYDTYETLKPLERTLAGRLSGGERKTLAIGRVLMAAPSMVLLDEPTSNLAPIPSAHLLEQDVPALARSGVTVLLVEQRAVQAIAGSDWVYVLVGGRVEAEGSPEQIGDRRDIGRMFLGASLED
ncbi:MAG TPA: ABC transporter ATP-binding protein [Solirubrobacteraceae bacterium]|nr:ABC transporter ATP-binding protein [Solirubrobacteraceae bacterium]